MKNIVSIIPARGCSKGIPKKNLKNFCGKPNGTDNASGKNRDYNLLKTKKTNTLSLLF